MSSFPLGDYPVPLALTSQLVSSDRSSHRSRQPVELIVSSSRYRLASFHARRLVDVTPYRTRLSAMGIPLYTSR